jgi:hypothetical protein
MFLFCFGQMTVLIGIIDPIVDPGFLHLDAVDFKIF